MKKGVYVCLFRLEATFPAIGTKGFYGIGPPILKMLWSLHKLVLVWEYEDSSGSPIEDIYQVVKALIDAGLKKEQFSSINSKFLSNVVSMVALVFESNCVSIPRFSL